jgi:phosphoglycolate phosphatase
MNSAGAVLFDLDGTLTDSRLGILRCARYAFERLSATTGRAYPLPRDEDLNWIVGPPLRDSFGKLAGVGNAEALMGFYLERYQSVGAFENQVYDGIPEALGALRASGAALFVATSKNEADALRILDHFALAGFFRGIHGAKADGGRADKSELLAYVLRSERLDAARNPIAMIGDRKFDAIGARHVGIAAIGALWGYGGAEELKSAGADPLVKTPREVPEAVKGVFARA